MKIQTKVERNEYPNNIERADFSSKVDERGVGNISGLKTAKMDSDGSAAIEMAQAVQAAGGVAVQARGILRTAVKSGASRLGSIKTFVRRGVNVGSVKDVGRIATAVNTSVANVAKDMGQQMLRTKIDKSTITDTGTETIKQGLTELRYADNVRRAAVNTARGVSNLKLKPSKIKYGNKRHIRKNAKKAAKIAASNLRKMVFSKVGLMILAIAAAIMLIIVIINGLLTVIISATNSMFSWLAPSSSEPGKSELETLRGYQSQVVEYIDTKQAEVNEIVDGFVCDTRSYSPYSEISELNQFGNKEIKVETRNEVLAILAVKKFRELGSDVENIESVELNFTESDISETLERFYKFEYSYSYGNCSAPYCKESEDGSDNYCDVEHEWLHGEVTNVPLDEVLNSYSFDDDEKALYQMYLEQINVMLGGG